jgi:hypothetical protein
MLLCLTKTNDYFVFIYNRYTFYRRLGRPQGRCGWVLKISSPPGFDLRTIQSVARRYTKYVLIFCKFLVCAPTVYGPDQQCH